MLDLKFEFSPVYWLHNFTLVPTTTTTTTTTTSTTSTTTPSTTTNKDIYPAAPPPNDDMGNEVANDESRQPSVTEDKVQVSGFSGSTKDKSTGGSDRTQQHWSVIAVTMVSLFGVAHCVL